MNLVKFVKNNNAIEIKSMFLKYDSFKKDNRKNCWLRTCLLPSNFIVYGTDQKLGLELPNALTVDNQIKSNAVTLFLYENPQLYI